jgi:hypothetical protein
VDLLKNTLLVWARYREFRAVPRELNRYSDRELASELRITRADIPRIAFEEAERRVAVHPTSEPRPAVIGPHALGEA